MTSEVPPSAPFPSLVPKRVRALVLLSGGLDSQLAVCVLRSQGIHVEAVVFESPFFDIRSARKAAQAMKVDLHILDFTRDILELIKSPRHGFGAGLNPCIDCHARMVLRAGEKMRKMGFDFIATGEVLKQRPMSQHRRGLALVAKESGMEDILLRPLSAKLLMPTPMELDGRVDREKLLALEGRVRRPQMDLAAFYGLEEYPSPAGGCKLTEPNFAKRLKELRKNEGLDDIRLVELLKNGRHFRLPGGSRVVVGRSRTDNDAIRISVRPGDCLILTPGIPGPIVLLLAGASESDRLDAMRLCASYCDHEGRTQVTVRLQCNGVQSEHAVAPMVRNDFTHWML